MMLTTSEQLSMAVPRTSGAPKAIVIGSGFGGLAAAIRLSVKGYDVTVLEKLDAPGGRAYVFHQDGYTFDAGPTMVTAPALFEDLWRLCGRELSHDVELRALTPFYKIRFADGETFTCSSDPEEMRAEVGRISPGDVDGYERFMADSEAIRKVAFEELADVPFSHAMDMVRVAPALVRFRAHRSVYAHVASRMRDERLRAAFSFHPLFIGGNPFSSSSVYSMIASLEREWGVHFAMGGTGALVRGMVNLLERNGGRVRCDTEVAGIEVDNRNVACGVTLVSGEPLVADIVVSNADVAWTYGRLLKPTHRRHWTDRKLERSKYSMSLFVWYFGTTRRFEDVDHHTILLGPRYKALLHDIFKRKVLPDDFSLYLHRPTATDPSLAPDGCDAFYVLSPVPNLEADIDWPHEAERYRAKIAQTLDQTVLPGFEDTIATSRIMTPDDFEGRLLSYRGAAFSMQPLLTQSAWFRPHNVSEDVRNLFIVGAGTHPGAGLPGVLSSAKILDRVTPHADAFC